MHPAPSLAELLKSDDPRTQSQQQQQPSRQLDHQPQHDQVGFVQTIERQSPARVNSPPVRYVCNAPALFMLLSHVIKCTWSPFYLGVLRISFGIYIYNRICAHSAL